MAKDKYKNLVKLGADTLATALLDLANYSDDADAVVERLLASILARAKSKYYHHGISYLKKLDSLAPKVREWKEVDPHSLYLQNLRQKHKLKSSFWSQYTPQKPS